jgi:hypothetical protein
MNMRKTRGERCFGVKKRGEVGGSWKKIVAKPTDAVEITPRDLTGRVYIREMLGLWVMFFFQSSGSWEGIKQRGWGGLRVRLGELGEGLGKAWKMRGLAAECRMMMMIAWDVVWR